ncbi:MAG TPA: L,D-transpeptidase family protein [Vicinamibacterales bacterium]
MSGCHRDGNRTSQLATAIRQVVAGPALLPVQPAVWTDVRTFYDQRDGAPAWVSDGDVSKGTEVLQVLQSARAHGFAPEDYGEPQLAERLATVKQSKVRLTPSAEATAVEKPDTTGVRNAAPDRLQQLAELDVRLTTALLEFGRDVAAGRMTPAALDRRWKARRELPDLAGTLSQAAGGDLKKWIDTVRPQHPEYAALQQALMNLQAQRDKGGWPQVAAGTFAPGRSNPSVVALRQRLTASGHLTGSAASNTSPVYTREDEAGVRAFQALHALKETGVADAATLAAMNVPLDHRIRQVEINLERWRWMPNDLGARHLLVNIPYYHLIARENSKPVMDIRVIVGKPDEHKTPVFSSEMTTVVFSPYWNIPDSIVEGETAPAVARDPAYLTKNNIEILDVSKSGAAPVDYASVNWDDASQLKHLAFRQRPGPGNALGHVKFLFPNEFDVYLHDTPADALFARPGRAFSHGCVRVEEPEALAKYVLRGDSEWDDMKILEAMHAGVEKHVKLKENIPVHIVYFTAWVDENGGLHFQPDVYGYDAEQAAHTRAL